MRRGTELHALTAPVAVLLAGCTTAPTARPTASPTGLRFDVDDCRRVGPGRWAGTAEGRFTERPAGA